MSPALLLPLLLGALPLPGQDAATDATCATVRPAFPTGLEGWSVRMPLDAGSSTRNAPVLVIGRAAELRLTAGERLTPAVAPAHVPEAGTGGGLALFQVARAGTYRIALGQPAWIEVVRAGKALPAAAHGHGPACTGIRKMVDYRLSPGRYVLQLTGTNAATVPVMIAHGRKGVA
ncbi:hypothetical protein [Sphingomonas endophytica]|uniref:Homogentisate 1,2-dioxygenase n=1 Tax=Sphingomonas endophytica TaxID=869719 RepID=A0A147I1J3_9SPHN|nr:hypothetical protein [Sphingomonas endophytica]KTT71414.1 hypothetical protein NS334_10615 [Sphingomonas endophytica]